MSPSPPKTLDVTAATVPLAAGRAIEGGMLRFRCHMYQKLFRERLFSKSTITGGERTVDAFEVRNHGSIVPQIGILTLYRRCKIWPSKHDMRAGEGPQGPKVR